MNVMHWVSCVGILALGSVALGAGVPPSDQRPKNIVIAVTADGTILWNGKPVTCEELNARFQRAANSAKPGTRNPRLHCESYPFTNAKRP